MANHPYLTHRFDPCHPESLLVVNTKVDSPLGWIGVCWRGDRVFALSFGHFSYAEAQSAAQEKAKIRNLARVSRIAVNSQSDTHNHPFGGDGEPETLLPSELPMANFPAADFPAADFPAADRLAAELTAFASGEPVDFSAVPVVGDGLPPFARKVLNCCREIPYGQVLSYGELAAKAGSARAARSVGTAMSQNFIPLIVPCHRVIAAGGKLGGYSAAGGLETKQQLLKLEGSWPLASRAFSSSSLPET